MDNAITYWQELSKKIEELTRSAKSSEVENLLLSISVASIPRSLACQFADLARRNSLPDFSLKILNSYVRGKQSEVSPPSDEEVLAYANALNQMECNEEAYDLFKRVDERRLPKVLLHKALSLHGLWKYRESIPILKRYVTVTSLTDYDKAIGNVNLLASYVHILDLKLATKLSSRLLDHFRKNGYLLLLANTLELTAQIEILKKNYSIAIELLDEAEKILSPTPGIYLIFVNKWKIIAEFLEGRSSSIYTELQFTELLKQAINLNLWETVRDIHFFFSLLHHDMKGVNHILVGSQNLHFKRRALRLIKQFHGSFIKSSDSIYTFSSEKSFKIENQIKYKISNDFLFSIKKQKKLKLLFQFLIRDLYRPPSLGGLYKALYPDEKFDVIFATRRIQNLVAKLNVLFRKKNLPLFVLTKKYEFFLQLNRPYTSIIIDSLWLKEDVELSLMRSQLKGNSFSAEQASICLARNLTYIRLLIRNLLRSKILFKISTGRSTRYIFNNYRLSELNQAEN